MRNKSFFLFLLILALAAILRFVGLNWDDDHHLHPDERFLTMVNTDSHWPSSFSNYLNQAESLINPYNNNYDFFVYGNLPLVINKGVAIILDNNNYHQLALQGRALSIICDLLSIYLIFLICQILEKKLKWPKQVKYLASFSYSLLVLTIQMSHFYTTDLFLNVFGLSSVYFALQFFTSKKTKNQVFFVLISGIFWACALASKISAVFYAPLLALIFLINIWQQKAKTEEKTTASKTKVFWLKLQKTFFIALLFALSSYFALRLADPYYFAHPSFFNPTPNPLFLKNIETLTYYNRPDIWFPPAVQWIGKSNISFALKNLSLYGWGIINTSFIFYGIFLSLQTLKNHLVKNKKLRSAELLIAGTLLWMLGFFIYQSSQFAKTMRYFIIICPFVSIFAGLALAKIFQQASKLLKTLLIILMLIWPLMFTAIYIYPHSRVTASKWIVDNLPTNSTIASELWDDALPLNIENNLNKQFQIIQLEVFSDDTETKWTKLNQQLNNVDYYVLSSNRAWGSISQVPEKYPLMSKFYQDLFAEKLNFKKIAQFEVFPNLNYLGLPLKLDDSHAEEAFSVYDHPQVIIFERIKD